MKRSNFGRIAVSLLATLEFLLTPVQAASPGDDPAAATIDLYARMSARDLTGLLHYLPATGLSEIGPDALQPRILAPAAFQALFSSGLSIALHAEEVAVQRYGDVAVVTGVRVGTIGARPASSPVERDPFTMVWTLGGDGWQLRHIHLSTTISSGDRDVKR